jgi:hypothetical protein
MKFKHGDYITCTINGKLIKDARISICKSAENNRIKPYICQNSCAGDEASNKLCYVYSWALDSDFTDNYVSDLRLVSSPSRITLFEDNPAPIFNVF